MSICFYITVLDNCSFDVQISYSWLSGPGNGMVYNEVEGATLDV